FNPSIDSLILNIIPQKEFLYFMLLSGHTGISNALIRAATCCQNGSHSLRPKGTSWPASLTQTFVHSSSPMRQLPSCVAGYTRPHRSPQTHRQNASLECFATRMA